jgi:hypothetical protein
VANHFSDHSRRGFLAGLAGALTLGGVVTRAAEPVLDLIVRECKVPVVSSTPHALMTGVRLLGLSGRVQGFGRVLAGV